MKRSLLATAAALLISTTAASAQSAPYYQVSCDAPTVQLGDTRDNNPVVSTDITYSPDEHQWRVFHNLANGLVVSRSEQYAVLDATNGHKVQWQGSLNRNRSIYMVGELNRDNGGMVYNEWMYDRAKGNLLVMQMTARCAQVSQPQVSQAQPQRRTLEMSAAMLFMVPADVSGGHMNIRNGPGAGHGLLGSIPAGQLVTASRCVPRDDGIAGADWCLVNWNGVTGWVSQAGLMPLQGSTRASSPVAPVLPRPTS